MKNDLMTTVLNFVLAGLVLLSVFFALMTIQLEPKIPALTIPASQANQNLLRISSLLNDTAVYNTTARSPELARILAILQQHKPAAR